jgi:DNA-binding NtrC family response regulator
MPWLRVIEGPDAGARYELTATTIIGRDPATGMRLGDGKASRHHAEVRLTAGRWELVDLGSSNGTWSEDGRIVSQPLSDGFTFRIGSTFLRFELRPGGIPGGMTTEMGSTDPGQIEALDRTRISLFGQDPAADLARINAYLVLLHQIVVKSHQTRGREALFELLDDTAAEALDGDRCAVFLPSPKEPGWTLWPTHERRLRARFGATPFARTLLSAVRERNEPLLCTGDGDLGPSASMLQAGVFSAMAAPLRIGDEVHALLYVDRIRGVESARAERAFTRPDLEFLAAVANQLAVQLHNQERTAGLEAEVERLKADPKPDAPLPFVIRDPSMQAVEAFIRKAAPTDAPVLILGESGTGKELTARALHRLSKRSAKPLQVVNCAAIPESLVESTLFGHVKGAFTGAEATRPGIFELADGGTLFLDEIGELPIGVQAKLLRALEQGEVQRIGEAAPRMVDVRLIAATNRDLAEEAKAKRFRTDLLHRLDVLAVTLPPLRQRPADIDALVDHFLTDAARRLGHAPHRLAPEARALLLAHPWPGNVRQLKNTIERAVIMAAGPVIAASDLPDTVRGAELPATATPIGPLHAIERMHILRVLDHCGGNKKATAELLQIDRSTLYAKLRQYGVLES